VLFRSAEPAAETSATATDEPETAEVPATAAP